MEAVLQGKSFRAPGGRGDTWNCGENQFPLSSQKEERAPGSGSNSEAPEGRPIIARGKAAQQPPPRVTSKRIHFFVIRPPWKANDEKGKGLDRWLKGTRNPSHLNPWSFNSQSQDQPQRVKANQLAFSVCRAPFAADPLRLALLKARASSPCSAGVPPASSRSVSLRVPSRHAAVRRKGLPCP